MSILTPEEVESLRDLVGRPRAQSEEEARVAKDYALIRGETDLVGAMSALEGASEEMAFAIEQTLTTRMRRPWTVAAREPYKAALSEMITQLPQPVVGVWQATDAEPSGFLMMGRATAQSLVLSLLGVDATAAATSSEKLGAIDRRVVARLMRGLGDQLASAFETAGVRLPPMQRFEADWRGLTPQLKSQVLIVLPIEIREPIEARIDIVIAASFVAHLGPGRKTAAGTGSLAEHVGSLPIEVVAELGSVSMTVDTLTRLVPGNVLLLGAETAPIAVAVDGAPRYLARPEAREGRVMVRLVGQDGSAVGGAIDMLPARGTLLAVEPKRVP